MNELTATNSTVILEENLRLSENLFWEKQREYFDQQGIDAWVNQVPFYITSNPFISHCYAKVVLHFVRDWITKHPEAKHDPFYILELGTGSGRFSFYTLKALHQLKQEYGMSDVNIVYIMSDFTIHNLKYHQEHAALQPYIEQGLVDFAIYNLEVEQPIQLIRSGIELNADTIKNPLMVFANYIFDTVSQDAFSVSHGKLCELRTTLTTEADNVVDGRTVDWEKINIEYIPHEINKPYYEDADLNAVLDLYKERLLDTSFLIPIGTIRAIRLLKKLTNNKFFMIGSDKAYSELSSLENLGHPSMAFHGSFSMMANFHAIGQYLINGGGDYFAHTSRRGIKTCLFSSGFRLQDLPETRVAFHEYIDGFNPADYFNFHKHVSENSENIDLDTLAAHLQLSQWDPYVYARINNRITACISDGDSSTIDFLSRNMHKIAENYYFMPKSECVLFEIGVFYHSIKHYDKALNYYYQAEKYTGDQFGLRYNIALCLHHSDNNTEALKHFKASVKLDSESKEAVEWVSYLEKIMHDKKFQPREL